MIKIKQKIQNLTRYSVSSGLQNRKNNNNNGNGYGNGNSYSSRDKNRQSNNLSNL